MASNCSECKFEDIDYVWDEECEDEIEIRYCFEGHNSEFESDCECPYFRKFRPCKYIEKDTKCDKCQKLKDCIKNGNVLRATMGEDTREHYIIGIGARCDHGLSE